MSDSTTETLQKLFRERILLMDGAMGTTIQAYRLQEEDFRGERLKDHGQPLQGNNDIISLTRPEIIEEIQSETNEVIKAMDIGRKRVLIGTKLVKGTRQTLTDLAKVSTSINRVVEQIAKSASTQVNISNELNQTMQDVAEISNLTSEQSVKVAESFTKLLGVAGELQQSVSEFKVK